MKVKHVCWDMDGTLAESESVAMGVVADAMEKVVLSAGKSWNRDHFLLTKTGLSLSLICNAVEDEFDVIIPQRVIDNNPGETLEALGTKVTATPGVTDALNWLKTQGIGMSLVTSSDFDRVGVCLGRTGLENYFDQSARFSGSSSLPQPKHKPDPAIYLHALEQMNLDAETTVAVEDSPTGVMAARAAGITPIGYVGANHIHEGNREKVAQALRDAGAVTVIQHFKELPTVIRALESGSLGSSFLAAQGVAPHGSQAMLLMQ